MSAYKRYEAAKAAWVKLHPDATPEQYEVAMQRIAAEFKYVDKSKLWADKAAFADFARTSFVPTEREACAVCGKHRSLTHAHHIMPIAIQWDTGVKIPIHDHVWLCPTHHAAVHIIIGQAGSKAKKASAACISVINDLAEDGLEVLRETLRIADRAWK